MEKYIYEVENFITPETSNKIIDLFENETNKNIKMSPAICAMYLNLNDDNNMNTIDDIEFNNEETKQKWIEINNELLLSLERYLHEYIKRTNINDDYNSLKFENLRTTKYVIFKITNDKNINISDLNYNFIENHFEDGVVSRLEYYIYLNNNYSGGDIIFSNDLIIKPKNGKIIIYPAAFTFPRKYEDDIIDGNKYIIAGHIMSI
jgi:hypothetical protein